VRDSNVNVSSKINKKIVQNILFFVGILKVTDEMSSFRKSIPIRSDNSGKLVPYGYATRNQSGVQTANVKLVVVKDGLMDPTVVIIPSTSEIPCLVPLIPVRNFSS
jgi:hypothetical protein